MNRESENLRVDVVMVNIVHGRTYFVGRPWQGGYIPEVMINDQASDRWSNNRTNAIVMRMQNMVRYHANVDKPIP